MKKYRELWFPEGDEHTPHAVHNEWDKKGQAICDMVPIKNTVVQAGGNAGLFPINLSSYFTKVVTFEPITETYNALVANLKERPSIKNIELHKVGLGENFGKAEKVVIDPKNHGAHQIKSSEDGEIAVIPLDSLELRDVNLMWLDVEGSEVKALNGSKETIERCKPIIVLENKGLIPGFGGNLEEWMRDTFGYKKVNRLMNDDVFISEHSPRKPVMLQNL